MRILPVLVGMITVLGANAANACKMTPLGGSLNDLQAVLKIYTDQDLRGQQRNSRIHAIYFDSKANRWITEVITDKNLCAASAWEVKTTTDCRAEVRPLIGVTAIPCRTESPKNGRDS